MLRRVFVLLFSLLPALVFARSASASPEAHILRIDPRTGLNNGKPVLTSVIEVVQFKRLSDVLQPCANTSSTATLTCWSDQLEKPGALWDPFPFPEERAHFLVKVAGEDVPAKFADKIQWGKAQSQPNVGTAWLIAVDASNSMGTRFGDARAIAHEFIQEMQPNDLMDIMFFDDVQTVRDTKWKSFKQRADLGNALNDFQATSPSHGRDRALFSQIKTMTRDAFGSLGNSDQPDAVPLHQAMVVLSNGAGRGDPESASPSADVFHAYLDKGRFPDDNTSLPKTPLPVVSIWLPNASSMMESIYRNNEAQFMQALANPEIGGFFDIVQQGQGNAKAKTIIGLVRARYNAMWLVHWTMSCINPSVEQTFDLVFDKTNPVIAPDGTFKDVPIGIDPTQWPLDVDIDKTVKAAQGNPLYPGGQFSVYGDFCWSGDKQRAEAYFIPAGTKPSPQQMNSRDPDTIKKAMQQLQAEHMLGTAVAAGDGYVTFTVPDDDKVLEGTGDNAVARVVVYDNKAHRASAVDEKTVLTLKATKKPLSLTLIAGIAGLVIVIILLVMVLLRGGGGGRKRGGAPPSPGPGPSYGSGGYGGPPAQGGYGPPPQGGGYGPPPQGGGYGMQQSAVDPLIATVAVGPSGVGMASPALLSPPAIVSSRVTPPPSPASPASPLFASAARPVAPVQAASIGRLSTPQNPATGSGGSDSGRIGAPPVVKVTCPACGMGTMATPGQPSICFSCGQPLPSDITDGAQAKGGGGGVAPGFPAGTSPIAVPLLGPQPYAPSAPAYAAPSAATLRGTAGQFTIRAGSEVRVGRDPTQCPILLAEPRVSGIHASLRFEGGQLLVRDETSNNGTWLAGSRIPPSQWTPVAAGTPLRFGPVEFTVQLEA